MNSTSDWTCLLYTSGKMDIHITPQGQAEIRGVIHHFNAMVRSLRSLIADYEEQVRRTERSNGEYFTAMIRGELSPEQVAEEHAGLRYLYGESAIVDLEERRTEAEVLRKLAGEYSRLADTLYGADAVSYTHLYRLIPILFSQQHQRQHQYQQ